MIHYVPPFQIVIATPVVTQLPTPAPPPLVSIQAWTTNPVSDLGEDEGFPIPINYNVTLRRRVHGREYYSEHEETIITVLAVSEVEARILAQNRSHLLEAEWNCNDDREFEDSETTEWDDPEVLEVEAA